MHATDVSYTSDHAVGTEAVVSPGFSLPSPSREGDIAAFGPEGRSFGLGGALADAAAITVAAFAAAALEAQVTPSTAMHPRLSVFYSTVIRLLVSMPLITVFVAGSHPQWRLRETIGQHLSAVARGMAMGGLISLAGWRLAAAGGLVRPPATDSLLNLCGVGLLTVCVVRMAHHASPRRGGRRARRVLVVGSGLVAGRVTDQLRGEKNVDVVGFVDDDPTDPQGWLGQLDELSLVCERHEIDHLIVAFSRSPPEEMIDAIRPVQGRVAITIVPRLFDVLGLSASLHEMGSGLVGISVATATFSWGARLAKRSIDLMASIGVLIALAPLLVLVGMVIKLTSRGPVIFRQIRIGQKSQAFSMVKFRTMRIEDASGHASSGSEAAVGPFPKFKDDPRVTSVGRVLRRTSLDELPQLWNVVRGEMSLVGPRPFVPDDDAWITDWAQLRYSVRPGLTGLWQVSGRNNLTFEEMCRLDSLYVSTWSPSLDLRILGRTMRAVVVGSGAF